MRHATLATTATALLSSLSHHPIIGESSCSDVADALYVTSREPAAAKRDLAPAMEVLLQDLDDRSMSGNPHWAAAAAALSNFEG